MRSGIASGSQRCPSPRISRGASSVASSAVKTPRRIYWTEGAFSQIGRLIIFDDEYTQGVAKAEPERNARNVAGLLAWYDEGRLKPHGFLGQLAFAYANV